MTEPASAANANATTVADAVRDADLRALLMSVFQISGDRRWLGPPFVPRRDVRLIADEDAGLAPEVAEEIRAAAIGLDDRAPAIDDPGDALMVEMMSVCVGEPVPPEYAPMMREELGFTSRDVDPPDRIDPTLDVLVVGAGASGIAMAVRLQRLGVAYTVIERRSDLGGVWHDNRYPGCAVDTPNHAYSFSFAPPNRWSRFFAPQPEIEDYLRRTADGFAVTDHIEFDTTLRRADWSDDDGRWHVELQRPNGTERRSYRFLVCAIGQLNEPKQPAFAGIDDFEGIAFHSSSWPGDLDLVGKRVAIVGTGASAMQIAPAIAEEVGALTIVQRSPQWVRPIQRYHDPIPAGSQWLFEHLPFYAAWCRFAMFWRYGDGLLPFLRKDDTWPHPQRAVNRGNDRHRIETTDHIIAELGERTDLIEKCVPTYPVFGKRILLDNGWYRMLRRPNVELVTSGVERVAAGGFVTDDGRLHRADVIVFATGFEVTQMAARLHITGRDGLALSDVWADENPAAYLGISIPGFPNLFCLQGPNTGLAHGGSAIFQSECQARHITGCIAEIANVGATSIEAKPAAQDAWVAAVDAEHEHLVWTHPGMSTYYRNRHGRIVSVMPWRLVDYWSMTHDPDLDAYEVR